MYKLLPYIPEFLAFILAGGCLYTLYKLEILYLQQKSKRPATSGIWRTLLRDRLAQTIVASIAIPDIPVLVKLFM